LFELAKQKGEGFSERIKASFSRSILITLPIYLIVFSGGSIVDAIYPASIIVIVAFLGDRQVVSGEGTGRRFNNAVIIFSVAFAAFLADMSRPYAPFVLLILLAAAAAQKNLRVLLGLIMGILLSLPYHSIQLSATGSPLLTNYTGCNLMEVYKPDGLVNPGGMKDTHQLIIAERCKQNERIIKAYMLKNPLAAIKDFLYFPRLSRSAFPAPFTPWQYEGFPAVSSFEEFLQWSLWAALIIFLYIPLVGMFVFSLSSGIGSSPSNSLALISVALPYLITIATNGGQEAGRVGLAFLLPICFITARELAWKVHRRL
jgi:hypothetical protein